VDIGLAALSRAVRAGSIHEAFDVIGAFLHRHGITYKFDCNGNLDDIICDLVSSVNVQRLSNHPVRISGDVLAEIYRRVLTRE